METPSSHPNKSIMVIGAHADDIEINVAGTFLKYRKHGYGLHYVMATNNMSGEVSVLTKTGVIKKTKEGPLAMMQRRKAECETAAKQMGTFPIHLDHPQRHYYDEKRQKTVELRYGCDCPDGVDDDIPSILTAYEDKYSVQRLTDLIIDKNPECIFTHGVAHVNIEHYATGRLVAESYWQAVKQGYKGALLMWREGDIEFGPYNLLWETYIDYSSYLDQKMDMIGLHRCQMPKAHLPEFGHRIMAKHWGGACGCLAAEVFTWVKRSEDMERQGLIYPPLTLELLKNTK